MMDEERAARFRRRNTIETIDPPMTNTIANAASGKKRFRFLWHGKEVKEDNCTLSAAVPQQSAAPPQYSIQSAAPAPPPVQHQDIKQPINNQQQNNNTSQMITKNQSHRQKKKQPSNVSSHGQQKQQSQPNKSRQPHIINTKQSQQHKSHKSQNEINSNTTTHKKKKIRGNSKVPSAEGGRPKPLKVWEAGEGNVQPRPILRKGKSTSVRQHFSSLPPNPEPRKSNKNGLNNALPLSRPPRSHSLPAKPHLSSSSSSSSDSSGSSTSGSDGSSSSESSSDSSSSSSSSNTSKQLKQQQHNEVTKKKVKFPTTYKSLINIMERKSSNNGECTSPVSSNEGANGMAKIKQKKKIVRRKKKQNHNDESVTPTSYPKQQSNNEYNADKPINHKLKSDGTTFDTIHSESLPAESNQSAPPPSMESKKKKKLTQKQIHDLKLSQSQTQMMNDIDQRQHMATIQKKKADIEYIAVQLEYIKMQHEIIHKHVDASSREGEEATTSDIKSQSSSVYTVDPEEGDSSAFTESLNLSDIELMKSPPRKGVG